MSPWKKYFSVSDSQWYNHKKGPKLEIQLLLAQVCRTLSVVSKPAVSPSPRSLLETQILRPKNPDLLD